MANYNKKISETALRLGEVRFSFCHVFSPRKNDNGEDTKYTVQILLPKADAAGKKLLDDAVEAAKKKGVAETWGGKLPPASKLTLPLRDGDEEYPDDPNYAGMWFLNASTSLDRKPGVRVLENGVISEALDDEDFYSGCWGAVTLNLYPYNKGGNTGVGVGLNNLIKTRDGDRLAGGHSAEEDFSDLLGDMSCLD